MWYLIFFGLSCGLSWWLTKLTIRYAFRFGFVDDPNRKHSAILHTSVIPRAGGVPVWLSMVLVSCVVAACGFFVGDVPIHRILALFLGGLVIVGMGLWDDKYDIAPGLRLVIQFACALLVVWSGVGVSYVSNPLGAGVISFEQFAISYNFLGKERTFFYIANFIAIIWIVSLMNMLNWSSGLDGQNAGISTVALLVLGFSSLRPDNVSETAAILAFVGAGAFAGFWRWSAFPQKIMPGFGGANWSGYLIAVLAIISGAKFATAIIVLAVPILDAIYVGVRRILRGKNPMKHDRTHLHHYLLDLGWSKSKIAAFYWLLSALLGILVLQLRTAGKMLVFALVVGLFLICALWIQKLLQSSKQ